MEDERVFAQLNAFVFNLLKDNKITGLRRTELAKRLIPKLNQKLGEFGVECSALWFTNLGVGIRTYRLLTDDALSPASW